MAITDKLTAIANAIRGKTGKTELLTLEQMPGEIEGIQSGGDTRYEDGLITNTLTEYQNNRVTKIGAYAFYNFQNLVSVVFENVTSLESHAFDSCRNLKSVNIPNLTTVPANSQVFRYCVSLESVSFEKLAGECPDFRECANLAFVNLPLVKTIGTHMFLNCVSLRSIVFPSVTTVYQSFSGMTSLEKIDFHSKVSFVRNNTFAGDTNIQALILRSDELCTLNGADNLAGSSIESGIGYIYVPSALLEEYKIATNWSVHAEQFRAIEGSEYE